MSVSLDRCVACGAAVPAVTVPTPDACADGGCEQLLGPQGTAAPSPYAPIPFAAGPTTSAVPALAAVAGLVALLVVAGAVVVFAKSRTGGGRALGPVTKHSPNSPGAGGVTPPGEHLQWASSGGASVVVVGDLNGDGVEDFVGRYRLLDMTSGTGTLYVGAFDGKTLKRIWAAGPYGTVVEAGAWTQIAVAAGRVVVTDFRDKAHVLDVRTGKEVSSLTLSDRVRSMCSPGDARGEVWVDLIDRTHGTIDTGAATWTPGGRPTWCAPVDGEACSDRITPDLGDGPCGVPMGDVSAFKDLLPRMWLHGRVGALDVVIGMKTPGTPVAIAMGVEKKTRAVKWRTVLAPDPAVAGAMDFSAATLAGGRLVTSYGTAAPEVMHLVVIDAETGARGVDVALPNTVSADTPGEIVVSGGRAYVPHWTWLDVVDLKAGAVVGTVGVW